MIEHVQVSRPKVENHSVCYECGKTAVFKAGRRGFCGDHREECLAWDLHESQRKTTQWRNTSSVNKKVYDSRRPRLEMIYFGIIQRCTNPLNIGYVHYGSRGIRICDVWRDDINLFIEWAITNGYANDLEIDRIDNDGNYEPGNCRWVNHVSNVRNSSTAKLTEHSVVKIRECIASGMKNSEISEQFGVSPSAIHAIKSGRTWKNIGQPIGEEPHSVRCRGEAPEKLTMVDAEQVIPISPPPRFKSNTVHLRVVQGGFMDDSNRWYQAPKRTKEAFRINGIWYWCWRVRDNHGKLILDRGLLLPC